VKQDDKQQAKEEVDMKQQDDKQQTKEAVEMKPEVDKQLVQPSANMNPQYDAQLVKVKEELPDPDDVQTEYHDPNVTIKEEEEDHDASQIELPTCDCFDSPKGRYFFILLFLIFCIIGTTLNFSFFSTCYIDH